MASTQRRPRADADFAHLSRHEVPPGELEQCVGSDGKPCVLGKGGFGEVGRCRLTLSKLVLKAPVVSALDTSTLQNIISCFQRLLSISTCAATER